MINFHSKKSNVQKSVKKGGSPVLCYPCHRKMSPERDDETTNSSKMLDNRLIGDL